MELFLNIILIICGIMSKFVISTIILISLFGYNLYYRKKRNICNMIIDNKEENIKVISKIGLEYKVKLILYILIFIITLFLSLF